MTISGLNLQILRQVKPMTKTELAAAAGMSYSGYRKLEDVAESRVRLKTLRALATALDWKLEDLIEHLKPTKPSASASDMISFAATGAEMGKDLRELYKQLDHLLERIAAIEDCSVEDLIDRLHEGRAGIDDVQITTTPSKESDASAHAKPATRLSPARSGGGVRKRKGKAK